MKPPRCGVCGKPIMANQNDDGGWVYFADHVPKYYYTLEDTDDYEWYCGLHRSAAEALSHKASTEAYAKLREQFKGSDRWKPPAPELTFWQKMRAWFTR